MFGFKQHWTPWTFIIWMKTNVLKYLFCFTEEKKNHAHFGITFFLVVNQLFNASTDNLIIYII